MPGELFYPEINGYTAIRRMRHRKAKALRFKPLMPGYFVAGFTTPTPDWETICGLAGGMHIRPALPWHTEAHPEGEPRPLTLVLLRTYEAQMRGEVGLIEHVAAAKPEHQAHQRTGAEFDVGDIVAVRYGNFAGFEGPVTRMRDASAWVDIGIFGRMSEVEIPQVDLAPVKLRARAA
jgi:transcription antitermination factor NusG